MRSIITMHSATAAMRSRKILETNGIPSEIVRLPQQYSDSGCAYGVSIAADSGKSALLILNMSDITYGKLISENETKKNEVKRNREGFRKK